MTDEKVHCPQPGPIVLHVDLRSDPEDIRACMYVALEAVEQLVVDREDPDSETSRWLLEHAEDDLRLRATLAPDPADFE